MGRKRLRAVYKLSDRSVFLLNHNRMTCSISTEFRYFISSTLIALDPDLQNQIVANGISRSMTHLDTVGEVEYMET